MQQKISIDGSLYQGGGQIIRSCLALSVILKKPFYIHSIRKNRPNPGINNQLRAILAPFIEKLPPVGSMDMHFNPSYPKLEKISSHSASSCTLMMQTLIPISVFLQYQKNTIVEGGTDVSKSPPLESINKCLIQILNKMGIKITINNVKKGYYPKGNGSINYCVKTQQNKIKNLEIINFIPPNNVIITYYLTKNKLPEEHVQLKKGIKKLMRQAYGQNFQLDIDFQIEVVKGTKTPQYGIGCILQNQNVYWDCSLVGQSVNEQKILQRLKHQIKNEGCLDEYHQDQFLIFMALANGKSKIKIGNYQSDHTKSMLYVLKQFLPDLKITFENGILQIQGINLLGK